MPMFSPITIKSLAAFSFFLLSGFFALAQTAQSIGDDRTGLGRPPPFYKQLDPDMRNVVVLWDEIRGLPIYQATLSGRSPAILSPGRSQVHCAW
jgi:hypothetical protein